jgi:hypothetical protein
MIKKYKFYSYWIIMIAIVFKTLDSYKIINEMIADIIKKY